MDVFDIKALRKCLNTYLIGRELRYWPEVDSTNATALRLAAEGAVEGTVVLAEAQNKGRGRAGKLWYSPPGLNLYLSVILRPAVEVQRAALMTLISSLAIADAIDAERGQAQVKWPNDVLLAGRKVAGVLTELQTMGEQIGALVLGIGVNINIDQDMLDRALGETPWRATSLKAVLGREVDRVGFATILLESLERRYDRFLASEGKAIVQEWKARSCLGQRARIIERGRSIEGVAADIDEQGCLLVRLDDGSSVRVFEGEILPPIHG
ncbi:MAG TPA: biotin--[acetyl-CoA-carboxylase] ligase [Candidatus Tectomicrobia bacterium]|nr:biotin--[acetyl-CoA-carboxylase] ligase [Candidatus Tectomicrobia bacterium]